MILTKTQKASGSWFPEAIRLMRLRHKMDKYFRSEGIDQSAVPIEIIEELASIEMALYDAMKEPV